VKKPLVRLAGLERHAALGVDAGSVRAEVLLAVVERERARVLSLVGDVGARARRHAHGARGELDQLTRGAPRRALGRGGHLALELHGAHVAVLVEQGLGGGEVLDVAHPSSRLFSTSSWLRR
jgi:hypothetical protein